MIAEPYELGARDRLTDRIVGLVALATLYALTYFFLSVPLASGFMAIWAGWVVLGLSLRSRRPDLVGRLIYASIGTWVVLVLVLNFANIS